jgi:hypothetical protein
MTAPLLLGVLRAFVVKSSLFSAALTDVAKGGDGPKSALGGRFAFTRCRSELSGKHSGHCLRQLKQRMRISVQPDE